MACFYSIDIVLFANGIPVVSMELKCQFTGQDTTNAINQYKFDRAGKDAIFAFKERVLVHFAVDLTNVYMTTRLEGAHTYFLPFNQGSNGAGKVGGKGNPVNPNGYDTAYLWERVLCKDSLMEILQKYMHLQQEYDKNGNLVKETMIFPRYHQLDVVTKLLEDVKKNGSGKSYLIQHSAGSGKSNSIAWLAHRLTGLHDYEDNKIFQSVIIVTDRRVLDSQLQSTVYQFDHVEGVVKKVDKNSGQLRDAINDGVGIIITTLQKFPVIYKEVDSANKRFAIIIDEAHSSQTGDAAKKLKRALADTEEILKEYAEMEAEITALREERLDALTPAGEGVTVYNTTGFVRSDVVELGDCKAEALQDEAGNVYPVQKTADGAVAFLNNLPAKGSKTFAVVPAQVSAAPFEIATDGHKIDTPFYTVTFDEHGQMTGIFDKENRREVLKPGQAGNLFRVYEDKPIYYDNWDIDIFYTEKFWDVTDLQDFTWTENGPVRATLHIERNYSNSTLVQDIHFYAKQRRIEFVTTVDWHEHQSLLKVHFPVNVHTDEATFEIQYGNLTRKTHANTSWDRARFESCGQKWMDLSEGHYGVSMLNDCKYGHSVKDSVIGLTLIKSGIEPNPTTDQEVHHFTYAIYPHAEKWQAAGTVPQAFFLNQPALAVQGGKPGESFSLAGLDAPNVVLETIKRAEDGDGAIVRMYECENSLTNVTLDWNLPFHAAESCNCLEQPDGEPVEVKDGKITFTVKPYEIKTIRIR